MYTRILSYVPREVTFVYSFKCSTYSTTEHLSMLPDILCSCVQFTFRPICADFMYRSFTASFRAKAKDLMSKCGKISDNCVSIPICISSYHMSKISRAISSKRCIQQLTISILAVAFSAVTSTSVSPGTEEFVAIRFCERSTPRKSPKRVHGWNYFLVSATYHQMKSGMHL